MKHNTDWELIHHRNQEKTNKDNIRQNVKTVGDKVIINNKSA